MHRWAPAWVVLLTAPLAASAGVFTVDSTVDEVDDDPGNGACLTTFVSGVPPMFELRCTLRGAVQESNALPGSDTIQLPAGTFTLDLAGMGDDTAATGDLDITDSVTISGAGAPATIVSADALDRVFDVLAGTVAISDLTVRLGSEPNTGGGIRNTGSLTLVRVDVSDNFAGQGGGLCNSGDLDLIGGVVWRNSANFGAGIQNVVGSLRLENSTVSGNQAMFSYGAIWNDGGALTLTASTVADNTAEDEVGGVASMGSGESFHMLASVIADNVATTGPADTLCSTITSGGANWVEDPGCDFTGLGGDTTDLDPALGPLDANGGPTLTHLPLPASGLVDRATPVQCVDLEGGALGVDQRGEPRPVDGDSDGTPLCDIGAVEVPEPGGTLQRLAALALLAAAAGRARQRARPGLRPACSEIRRRQRTSNLYGSRLATPSDPLRRQPRFQLAA